MMSKRTSRPLGFTLIELMVALSAGTVAIAAVYYLSGSASRTFNTQMRVSDLQMSLRMAAEQVRRDFGRAGYLAAPSAQPPSSDIPFQAIDVIPNGSMDGPNTAMVGTNVTRLDSVTLVANYATSEDYALDGTAPTDLAIITSQQAFRRSFGIDAATWAGPFEAVFAPGRKLRLENGAAPNQYYFVDIVGSNGAASPPSIQPMQPLPDQFVPDKAAIAPVVQLQYIVMAVFEGSDPALAALASPGAPQRMVLVRRELNMFSGEPIEGSERIVLDYVTEFRVDLIAGSPPAWTQPYSLVPDPTGFPANQVVSAVITLAARSPQIDRRLGSIGRLDGTLASPMITFQVGDDPYSPVYGAARVRSARFEVFFPNFVPLN